LGELGNENLKNRSSDELWNYVNRVNQLAGDYFLPNIAISITQGVLYRVLLRVITLFVGEKKAGEVFDQLMSFCETKTGQINRELYDLAELARLTPELAHLIIEKDSQELIHDKLLSDYSEFSDKFKDFLHCHGHREVDFDPYIPTWIDSPWTVVDNIRLILESEKADEPAEKERELKIKALQTEEALLEEIPQDLHFFFYEILRLARVYTRLDDLEHYQTTRLTLPLRRGLKALGENLVRIKVVETPMDIFFAHRNQLDRAVSKKTELEWDQLKNLIADQKSAYHKDKSRIPEWVQGQSEEYVDDSIDTLKGIPGSPGTLEGTVFQVLGPEDFSRFPKGAILVTRTTNPSWTPLFYSAAALVTESGGPLSHGAVTAREMGIPAVMSVRNCLARLMNGTKIRINGLKGTVQTLD
jgi:pyruvate,water dikinase